MTDFLFARPQMAMSLAFHINFVTPDLTFANSVASQATLRLLIVALGAAAIFLLPSLYFLFHIFKDDETR